MTEKTQAALRLALEALEVEDLACRYEKNPTPEHIAKAITVIKEALAEQPAQQSCYCLNCEELGKELAAIKGQELATYGVDWGKAGDLPCVSIIKRIPNGGIEVLAVEYGPQRTWVGMTHDEYDAICDKHSAMSDFDFLEDIEAKLKEKNQ